MNRKVELSKELNTWCSTLLHLAAAKGHLEMVKVLLSTIDHESLCFSVDHEGRNPMHLVAARKRLDVLREMIKIALVVGRVTLMGQIETILHVYVSIISWKF